MSERTRITLLHHVAARHGTTGAPVAPLRATIDGGTPPGWTLSVRGGDVVVTGREGRPAPAPPPALRIEAADPLAALRLAAPAATVTLDARELVHEFAPADTTVTVELVDPRGDPAPGHAVQARASNGTRVDLAPVPGEDGTYRSEPRSWTPGFHPFDLLVDGTLVRTLAVDFTRADTRVRVVDTT